MSLIVSLGVNQIEGAGRIVIQRMKGGRNPDSINHYKYNIYNADHEVVHVGEVDHRYGDGATRLAYLVLKDFYND